MELTNEFAKAVMCAYVALVNRLDRSGAVSKDELITVLSSISEILAEKPDSAASAQYLTAFVASLSGDDAKAQDVIRLLH